VSDAASAPEAAASPPGGASSWSARLRFLRAPSVGPIVVLVGSALIALAGVLPVWGSRLLAPQYPKGLSVWVYGGRAEGDVNEINGLNHYIGMRPIDIASVPELVLWPLVIVGAGVLLAMAVFWPGWIGRLALLALWLIPIGVLADIQRWLIFYGSELDPDASLRLKPFVPLAIGPSSVWNFTIWTYPGPALILIAFAALLAMVGRRAGPISRRARAVVSTVAIGVVIVATALFVLPASWPSAEPGSEARAAPPAGTANLVALIEGATAGATVVVPAGSYHGNVVIDRPLTLVANGEVLLDGGGRGTVVTITAPDVTLRGFRVAGSGGQVEEGAGVKVLADRVTLEGNRIERAFTGISVQRARGVRIVDNEVIGSGQVTVGAEHVAGGGGTGPSVAASPAAGAQDPHAGHAPGAGPGGQGDGISLWNTSATLIRGNLIEDVRDGVYLNYAEDVLLDTNEIRSSRYAVHAMFGSDIVVFGNQLRQNLSGLVFMNTQRVEAGRNVIVDSRSAGTGFGIVLKDVRGVRLLENVVARNRTGLQAEGTRDEPDAAGHVLHNRFAANGVGVALMATTDLVFAGNTFDGNLTQVLALEPGVERHNSWIDRGFGNDWSDYAGFDLAGDGIGDVPHLSGGAAQQVLAAAPGLEIYRTSPALHVLEAAQAVWASGRAPVVEDDLPLTVDVAPPSDLAPGAGSMAAPWFALAGGLLAAALATLLVGRAVTFRWAR